MLRTRFWTALVCLLIHGTVVADNWDCGQHSRDIQPDPRVIASIVEATRMTPENAITSLEALEQKYTGWRERAALYGYLGQTYLKLDQFADAQRAYQAGFDLEDASTAIRENYRAALSVVLSKLELDNEIIALYTHKDRPACEFADQAGLFILAQAYALKRRYEESEAIVATQLKREHDEIGELIYGDNWLKLGLATACELRHEAQCVSRWGQLLRWPFREADLSERLTHYLPLLRTWRSAAPALEQATAEGLIVKDVVVTPTTQQSAIKPIKRIAPRYPRDAARSRIEGRVVLDILVGTDGKALAIRIRDAVPAKIFDKAAVEAVMKWEFEPANRDGKPIPFLGRQVIDFSMKK